MNMISNVTNIYILLKMQNLLFFTCNMLKDTKWIENAFILFCNSVLCKIYFESNKILLSAKRQR